MEMERLLANGQSMTSIALKDTSGEDVHKDTPEAVRKMLLNKTPESEVKQTVLDLATQVERTVARNKETKINADNTKHLDSSDVLEIIEEILVCVDEHIIQPSKDKMCEPHMYQNDRNENKRGDKRTFSEVVQGDAGLDVLTMEATEDSLYIMNLVESELKEVELETNNNNGMKAKLVHYDDNSSESSESSDEESSDSGSTSDEDCSIKERKNMEKMDTEEEKISSDPPKTKDEILLKDLPPEPEVHIVLPDDVKLVHIGFIMSIVESMVVVKSLPSTPALDFDTLLFLEKRKCLGKVFETFGPVQSPFYSVRFNTSEDITKMEIKQGMKVFYAPEDFDCTKLVFVSQLNKLKGSDASWKHDQEPPPEVIEYSDDEEERKAKVLRKQERNSHKPSSKKQKDSKENAGSSPQIPPQHKESPRNWQGRGRGNLNLYNDQQQQPPHSLPHQFHRGPPPPPPFRGAAPQFMPSPSSPQPPFFPASLPQGRRPPPLPGTFNGPPLPSIPPHTDLYYVPPFPGVPPPWNHMRPRFEGPPPVFPPFENRPPPP